MAILSLPDAHILHSRGWGTPAPISTRFRVEFSDDGNLVLYRAGVVREKKVAWMSVDLLTMRIWTDNVRTGGGFFGGGFGIQAATEGMIEASVLNALTTRNREYVMLAVVANEWTGGTRELVLGWRSLSEAELRMQINAALPAWCKGYVDSVLPQLSGLSREQAIGTYEQLDIVQQRGLVPETEVARMREALARIAPPPPPTAAVAPSSDRVSQLKTLAELHASGALTDEEFAAEKARILER